MSETLSRVEAKLAALKAQHEQHLAQLHGLSGAIQILEQLVKEEKDLQEKEEQPHGS